MKHVQKLEVTSFPFLRIGSVFAEEVAAYGRNPKTAVAVYRELLSLDPNDTKVLAAIAKLELYQGNFDSAKRATSTILKIAPDDDLTILVSFN